MDYKPALPEYNDNISRDSPVKEALVLFSGVVAFFLAGYIILGFLVDWAVARISPEMEAAIFSGFSVPSDLTTQQDRSCQAALQQLADGLRKCCEIDCPVKIVVIPSDTANAMALAGGNIVVFSGIFDRVSSENGMAFVLAHELGHFKNRDHLRGMGRGIVLTVLSALLTGSGSNMTQLMAPGVQLTQARYSRQRESMADARALETLVCYYGHAGGADEFFQAMKEEQDSTMFMAYFASHPECEARIAALENAINVRHFDIRAGKPLPEVFKLIKN
ncbi:M48 family metallopeptidase [uncultured Desulfobacter sp.]|uniref:M48 family metallopeptidase n=1 Tax=uncultured Desulfobacter sp. TaxID=240139 RepID=UPI002AAB6106|nr:M48 family metallopeptidase [uncultured Desulfobacter sp.]